MDKTAQWLYCLWGRKEFDITEQLTFRCNWVHKLSLQVFLPLRVTPFSCCLMSCA